MKNRYTATVGVFLSILLAFLVVPTALAQAEQPTGATLGEVEDNVYTHPQAGFSFTLPDGWVENGYRWYETWGTEADTHTEGAEYVVEWVYVPSAPASRASTLLTFAVYDRNDWEAITSESASEIGEVIGEQGDWVYVATPAPSHSYRSGSADAQRFDSLVLTRGEVEQAFEIAPDPAQPAGAATEPEQWCRFAGTGATIAIDGKRVNFTCGMENESEGALLGDVTADPEGWQIERAIITRGEEEFTATVLEPVTITHIELEDGTRCAFAGAGATLAFDDERVNFTCGRPEIVLLGDITADEEGWQIRKATLTRGDDGLTVESSEMAQVDALGVSAGEW